MELTPEISQPECRNYKKLHEILHEKYHVLCKRYQKLLQINKELEDAKHTK